ncbi:MAG: hypothetical protein H0W44_08660 [Gammaproteobacteria bacterium]|nr:hypothetical protein [Gammaproteobacteria bacterium]
MNTHDDLEFEMRRAFLVRMLTIGAFASMPLSWSNLAAADLFGKKPYRMPNNKSIFNLQGTVHVNGSTVGYDTLIKANDVIKTGPKSGIVFVVGKDAFIMRADSELHLNGTEFILNQMRLVSGKILSVFGKRDPKERLALSSTIATIGIRGTGVYMEADPEQTYLCTCYGKTMLSSIQDPSSEIIINAQRHDSPRYILAKGAKGERIKPAPMINHTDLELGLIEELVGRTPPFDVKDMNYGAPRRSY